MVPDVLDGGWSEFRCAGYYSEVTLAHSLMTNQSMAANFSELLNKAKLLRRTLRKTTSPFHCLGPRVLPIIEPYVVH
jgi:hypothetical protein